MKDRFKESVKVAGGLVLVLAIAGVVLYILVPHFSKPPEVADRKVDTETEINIFTKLDARLSEKIQANPRQHFKIIVQFFEEPSPSEKKELETWMEITAYSFGPANFAEGITTAENIEKILQLSFVKWVEEQSKSDIF